MRKGRRDDLKTIWPATLETVWNDLPDDEKVRQERTIWERVFRRKIAPHIEGTQTESWIAEDPDGRLLGYLLLGEGGGFLTSERHGFVYDVWVAPDYRGRGVGKFLIAWAVDWARSKGYKKIKLEVAESNPGARHVYEEAGFRSERRHMGKSLE